MMMPDITTPEGRAALRWHIEGRAGVPQWNQLAALLDAYEAALRTIHERDETIDNCRHLVRQLEWEIAELRHAVMERSRRLESLDGNPLWEDCRPCLVCGKARNDPACTHVDG